MYRKILANKKLMEMASKGQKCKKETVRDRQALYFSNGLKINIDIHLFYFCVIIKGVSK